MLTITDLCTPVTEEQALEVFLSTLETFRIPARSWRKGGAYRNILRAVARSFSGASNVVAGFAAAAFLDFSTGGWLALLAWYVYGVAKTEATFASGYVLFTNTGGGSYDKAPGTVRVRAGLKVYATTEALSLHTPGETQLVAVRAVELGTASNAAPGLIDELETVLLGVTVTNPESVAGSEAEDDEHLRQRCRDKIAALSVLGARGAYAYAVGVALRDDGSPVDINRYRVIENPLTGVVTVLVASPSGTPTAADIASVAASVELLARPDSVTAVVLGASPVAFTKTLTVWAHARTGLDATGLQALVDAALVAMVAKYPIGGERKPPATQGYLFATGIEGTAKSADSSIFAIDGVGADLAIDLDEVATLAATVNVRIVS